MLGMLFTRALKSEILLNHCTTDSDLPLPPCNVLPGLQQDTSDVETQINTGSKPQKHIGVLWFDFSLRHHWSRNFKCLCSKFWFSPKHSTIAFISSFFLICSSYAPAISHSESQERSQQKKGTRFAFIFTSSVSSDWKLHWSASLSWRYLCSIYIKIKHEPIY